MHQPLSLLSLGAAGWVQIANFVVAGLLSCAFAAGLSRVLTTGPGSTWGSRLIALFGIGLVAGGVFTPDPALGYPVGTPDAIPQSFTWHGMVHAVAPPLAFTALVLAALVMARRFRTAGRRGWALYSWSADLSPWSSRPGLTRTPPAGGWPSASSSGSPG
jgi:hypothetical protein